MPSKNYSRKAIYVITNRSRRDNTSKNNQEKETWPRSDMNSKTNKYKYKGAHKMEWKKKKETLPQWSQVYSLHISNVQASHPVRTASDNDSPWKKYLHLKFISNIENYIFI